MVFDRRRRRAKRAPLTGSKPRKKEASERSTAPLANRLSPLKKYGFFRREPNNVFAGGESRAILVSSAGDGSKRRRPLEVRQRRRYQRFAGQGVEIAEGAVKQSLDKT
jgi:hypothetical protein